MNRKLVNGLLLLSVFTVGCGTFTSCKDNEEDYKNEILLSFNEQLKKAIDEVKCTCDKDLVEAMKNFLEMTKDGDQWKQKDYDNIYNLIAGYLYEKGADLKIKVGDKEFALGQELAKIPGMESNITQLLTDVADNGADIDKLWEIINNQITSIEVSQAYNHIFGTLNFPVGVQSNILGAYYGVSTADVDFPADLANTEVGPLAGDPVLGDIIAAYTGKQEPLKAGENYMDGEGNLGQLYLTMNPADKDFTGAALQLINSKGEVAPVELTAKKNEDLLTFGWTRANDNLFGLYRVDAKINTEDASKIAPKIDSELKGAFEAALKNPNKSDLVDLAKVLLDQLNGFLPAYAVKANPQIKSSVKHEGEDGEEIEETVINPSQNYVYSKFEIAATAVKPLGFEFLSGVSVNKKLPTFGPVSDAIESVLNDLKAKGTFNFDNAKITVKATTIEINLEGAIVGEDVEVNNIVLGYDGNLLQASVEGDNNTALNDFVNELVNNVNSTITKLQANINGTMEDIIKDIENKLLGKASSADKLLAKYNQLANTINNFLANPNSALQVMLAYEAQDGGIHRVSTDVNQPTIVKKGAAISLYTTTNTAEIVAPAYKKLVTVLEGNAKGEGLNTIIPGRQHKVGFEASATGLYKVAYSALDYRGKTSTKVYYIKVVD